MTSDEFVIWLRGFTQACHHLNATPSQWDKIIETLNQVEPCKIRNRMRKRSKKIQKSVDHLNLILSNKTICLIDKGELINVSSSDPRASAYKQGISDVIEWILHESETYNGFRYIDSNDPDRKYDRFYY